eukprot:CAMPEP_0181302114 /NCGR_PEP_ID=MMETSP1101-20121128/7791_1 /TAXON_ID=46948 /ORGANISM="Rhodomonas abbreviata, Strain Caron Lab Isolate" /LENGTH=245 /DNA_ID=CAMNT_0023407477 /DNA_START=84 /DNA_END=817 /DNA_ORIENTATION=+
MNGEDSQCAICWEAITSSACGALWRCQHKRSCRHLFHLKCIQQVQNSREVKCNCLNHIAKCPCCRAPFTITKELPKISRDPAGWFASVAALNASGPCGTVVSRTVTEDQVVEALSSQFHLDSYFQQALSHRIEQLSSSTGFISLTQFKDGPTSIVRLVCERMGGELHGEAVPGPRTAAAQSRGGGGGARAGAEQEQSEAEFNAQLAMVIAMSQQEAARAVRNDVSQPVGNNVPLVIQESIAIEES